MRSSLESRLVLSRVAVGWALLGLAVCAVVATAVFVQAQAPPAWLQPLITLPGSLLWMGGALLLALLANRRAYVVPRALVTSLRAAVFAVGAAWLWFVIAGDDLPSDLSSNARTMGLAAIHNTVALVLALRPRRAKVTQPASLPPLDEPAQPR
ncbi:MAG TPA: hypothetical protein VM536_07905 [Chloroflexia bacterium]|nr:hypothetical protein [Chloroflexia bacterium]